MTPNRTGLTVAAIGVIAVLVSLLANTLGISSGGFGAKHVALLLLGIVLIVAGLVVQRRAATGGSTRYR